MNIVYLLLGSNIDDRPGLLARAREEIEMRIGRITGVSSIYESEPWGFKASQAFLNQVLKVETVMSPSVVLETILLIEHTLGRVREIEKRYISRLIDIDILFFNDEIIKEENLSIPHPAIPDRMFTLMPMSELDGDFIHPASRKSICEMVRECQDTLRVYPYHS